MKRPSIKTAKMQFHFMKNHCFILSSSTILHSPNSCYTNQFFILLQKYNVETLEIQSIELRPTNFQIQISDTDSEDITNHEHKQCNEQIH